MTSLATVTLPDNLHWSDEFRHQPVAQALERTLSGALVVEETAQSDAGRPITLDGVWLDRATLDSLYSLVEQVNTTMTLTLPDGRTFDVLFRRDSPSVEAEPLFPIAHPSSNTLYSVTIRLMVAPQ